MDKLDTIPDEKAWRIYDQVYALFNRRSAALDFMSISPNAYYRMLNRSEIHPADLDIAMEARAQDHFSTLTVQHFADYRHWRRVRMAENGGKLPKRSK